MARILITSGPTRQYIDPVRYLSNASSGTMGRCLAQAALDRDHDVIVVSGPVNITYPDRVRVIEVVSTDDMLGACRDVIRSCDGMIGAAAPCDYRPVEVADHKIRKTGQALELKLVETTDIMAAIGAEKLPHQWTVGFVLETEDARFRALTKLIRKCCDLVVLNGATAINSAKNSVEIIAPDGDVIATESGTKQEVADKILSVIQTRLISPTTAGTRR